MSGDAMCSCGHIESAHRKMTNPACLAPTGYAFGAFSFGCSCTTFEAVSPGDEFRGPRNTIEESDELHDSPMFSAAVKEGGSRTCANPGLSAPILSTPIVSTTVMPLATLPRPQVTTSGALSASALRSTPIQGDIADGVTIPRWLAACIVDVDFPPEVWLLAARTICQAALEGEQ